MGYYVRLSQEIDRVYRAHRNSDEYSWRTWWGSRVVSKVFDTLGIEEHEAHITYSRKTDRKIRSYSDNVADVNTHSIEIDIWVSDEQAAFLKVKHPNVILWHDSHRSSFVYYCRKPNAIVKRVKHGIKIEHDWYVPQVEVDYTFKA
jgi:hypothetical protein